ncbi:hypothetical protein [Pusillimonas sp. ANT_WB101]|uniref:hypothetical protein n=1 Tax=Pusillimonas sp. ANT_WB101 TaxID=2597356 RepID=UPI00165E4B38|nr:hypothetical protein [Pusillimonas sp. ANT_WB101]
MNKTRTHIAIIGIIASMSLLAACSKEEDKNAVDSGVAAPVVVPETAPAPAPTPAPTPEPQVAPAAEPAPATSSTMTPAEPSETEKLKQDATEAGDAVADKAKELKDATAEKADEAGAAIRSGADKADKAIQDKLGDGSPSTAAPPPANQK